MRTEPPRPPVRRVVPCSCPTCAKPAGVQTDTILSIETRHGHRAVLSLHDLAAAAGYRLVPVERPPS